MGSNIPRTVDAFLAWANTHASQWLDSYQQIGLSQSQAEAFKSVSAAMASKRADQDAARQAAKDATLAFTDQYTTGLALAGAYVAMIKAYAETTGDMNVYTLAGISPDAPPAPRPMPVPPTQISAGVNTDGSLKISWKVTQPTGVYGVTYLVYRRFNTQTGPFTLVGTGTNKSFTDSGLPVGVDTVQYIIQPKRGEDLGEQSPMFSLQFGSVAGGGGGGGLNITTAPSTGVVKMAA